MTTQADSSDRTVVSLVVPLFNEADLVPLFIEALHPVLERIAMPYEVILVDDGSSDGTWQVVKEAAAVDDRVRGVQLSRNFGKDAAIFAGLAATTGEAVVVMDGDLQHPPSVIPSLLDRWKQGVEVVEGVKRSRPDQSLPVRIGARVFNRSFSRLTDVDLTEATDLRLLSRGAVDALLMLPEREVFFRATSTWIGFSRAQVHFDVQPRPEGSSRFRLGTLTRFAIRSLTAFTSAPLHLVTLAGVIFAAFSVVLGVHTFWSWIQGSSVEGFTTVILLLLILGSALLLGLGVIGEYLARIHDEVKARPRYIVARRTETPSSEDER